MSKKQFLSELEKALSSLSEAERKDILRDMEEYFYEAMHRGRTEEEVLKELGDPKALSETIIAETKVNRINVATTLYQKISAIFGALIAILVLTPFNLIFILFPLMFVTLFIAAGWILVLAAGFSAPVILLILIAMLFSIGFKVFALLSLIFFALGWLSMVTAIVVAFIYVTTLYFKGVSGLFQWNVRFVKSRMRGF